MSNKKDTDTMTEENPEVKASDIIEETVNEDVQVGDVEVEVEEEVKEVKIEPTTEEQLAATKDALMRKMAEFDNFRKRKIKEMDDARFYTKSSVIESFLTVYDHFQMAMQSVEQGHDITIVQEGMRMILAEFGKTFENLGLKEIASIGEKFDPNMHDAISKESSTEIPEGHIVKEWKAGYKLNDRLIRPATVVVSEGEKTEEAENE